jgi:hypothetical protein
MSQGRKVLLMCHSESHDRFTVEKNPITRTGS